MAPTILPLPEIVTSASSSSPSENIDPETPYLHFTPKRSIASFDNLVALANYQERLKDARKMVWRDRGEPVVEVRDLKACLEHAGKGAARSASLAFGIRAGINIVLALIRMRRVPKDYRFALIRHAIFGLDTFRFAAMLGTFTGVYRFLINALPLLLSSKPHLTRQYSSALDDDEIDLEDGRRDRLMRSGAYTPAVASSTTLEVPLAERRARLSLSAQARMVIIRKKTRRWHAVLAGAVAGALAIVWEKPNRRGVIAQQLFVRGLQGSYNAFSTKHNIHIPHGAVIVFALSCGQIMYAFLMRPDTLPRSYNAWVGYAAKVPPPCVRMNKDLVREGTFNVADLDIITSRKDITSGNLKALLDLRAGATALSPTFGPPHAPCPSVHPAIDSCLSVPPQRFYEVFKWMLPIYGALHFVPAVLFKGRDFFKQPLKMLLKAGWGTARSSAFLGIFVIIYQSIFCYKHYLYDVLTAANNSPTSRFKVPQWLINSLVSKTSFWWPGFICSGLSLFVEAPRRRGELAMYVLPKGLESAWIVARGKGLVFPTGNYGEILLTAIGTGMVMSTYQNDPQHLSGLVRRIMYQFIGPN
ncbi:hypothetical protein HGRIS_010342 [Hohenbuehelia grisea]|uniref:Transmembrane protein 135 N-terminal domain-containing protein n=1 Tax=Hohenbuehelia grisea TaxID=104357 RepID=A0ABR3J5H8_9AGAR